jgi:hypothetical protein
MPLMACAGDPPQLPSSCGDTEACADTTGASATDSGVPTSTSAGSQGPDSTATDTGPTPTGSGRLDVLIVVDNSGNTEGAQHRLAAAMPGFVEELFGAVPQADVRVMVTTTDVGSPLCDPFQPDTYEPAHGMARSLPCISHVEDFNDLGNGGSHQEACTDVCPSPIGPADDFVSFTASEDNVPDGTPGDALACLVPQGTNGCGFESPLQAMRLALTSAGPAGFLRADADLGVVMMTTELDCSLADASILRDAAYQNTDPATGTPAPTSAVCFNAGVACSESIDGTFEACISRNDTGLFPVDDYSALLDMSVLGKRVFFVPIVGVPPDGGLTYRNWQDGIWPRGDILPPDAADGLGVADQIFAYGDLGPGCTTTADLDATPDGTCCTGSICDPSLGGALSCLVQAVAA